MIKIDFSLIFAAHHAYA